MYQKILMPTDGSPCSLQALEHGLDLAKTLGAKVHFLYVLENPAQAIWIAPESVPYGMELLEDLRKAGEEAIKKAIQDYYDRNGIAYDKASFPDCEHCEHCGM